MLGSILKTETALFVRIFRDDVSSTTFQSSTVVHLRFYSTAQSVYKPVVLRGLVPMSSTLTQLFDQAFHGFPGFFFVLGKQQCSSDIGMWHLNLARHHRRIQHIKWLHSIGSWKVYH